MQSALKLKMVIFDRHNPDNNEKYSHLRLRQRDKCAEYCGIFQIVGQGKDLIDPVEQAGCICPGTGKKAGYNIHRIYQEGFL